MKKTNSLILSMMFLFLISTITALPSTEIPTSISLKCSETYTESFEFIEQINLTVGVMYEDYIGYIMGATPTANNHILYLSFFPEGDYVCNAGNGIFDFNINDKNYSIQVNVTEDLWSLDTITLQDGETLNVGGIAEFKLITSGETNALYSIKGCDNDLEDFIGVGNFVDVACYGETIRFWLEDSFTDLNAIKLKVFSSESGYTLIKDGNTLIEDGDCILGLNTMGADVKRGNVFAIKTINILDNKAIPGVSVMVLDQSGELSPLNGVSSNTGFINSLKLHEDYPQDLIVELEKEGCEPSTQVILFEQSYNDYIDEKETEEQKMTLIISDIEESYNFGIEKLFIVSNLINESIDNAIVKITNIDGISTEIKSNSLGQFNFKPESMGIYKIQISKMDYVTSKLYEINIKSADYVVSMFVDGDEIREFSNGDEIIFKIMDDNNTVLPLTFEGTYDNEIINFIDGVSEEVIFLKQVNLEIPEISGYESNILIIRKKESIFLKWIYWIGGGLVGFIILLVIFKQIIKKSSKEPVQSLGNSVGFDVGVK